MLCLTRKVGESIYIGDGPARIEVYVAEIQRNRVRLGITAPAETRIRRSGGPGGPGQKSPNNTRLHPGPCPRCGEPLESGLCSRCGMLWEIHSEEIPRDDRP